MLREGSGEPLFLFHGILCSERRLAHVVPLLAQDFDVIVPTALGHRGGPRPATRPASIEDVVDYAERQLDELGIEKAHLAGNSMGGWIALELARRGRARSVCALSPAGFWEEGWPERERAFEVLLARAPRCAPGPVASRPLLARSRPLPPLGHARSLPPRRPGRPRERSSTLSRRRRRLRHRRGADRSPATQFEPLEAPCPVTIAWAAEDRLFPLSVYEERARTLVDGLRVPRPRRRRPRSDV